MNCCIIPKNNFNIRFDLKLTIEQISPIISYSLFFYLNNIYNLLFKLDDSTNGTEEITIEYINKIVNPFQFIHTNVPGSIISVSKVKPDASIFFELFEVFQLFNINEILTLKNKINVAHLTPNSSSTSYLLNMLREDNNDTIVCDDFNYERLYNLFITNNYENNLDLIICEFNECDYKNTNNYINNILLVLLIVLRYQSNGGMCIIKLDNIFYKPIIDVIFILSGLYERVYLIKPSISNITTGERYLVCKSFEINILEQINLNNELNEKIVRKFQAYNANIVSLISNEIPYYFLNKLEESNAIIGQQQLEAYDQIINIFKNKNRIDKIDSLKRIHIQKCIQWCEKNQFPHNKFIDKVNIFLTPKKRDSDEELVL
jgi:hypothetical protein